MRLHAGPAVAGIFGGGEGFRDVIGRSVFVAARLEARTLSASADFFRKLSAAKREMLKKHSPPVVYIPAGDSRP